MLWGILLIVALAIGATLVIATMGLSSNSTSSPGGMVYARELAQGVHPRLQAFLDWWDVHGPFEMRVAAPPPAWVAPGGVRAGPVAEAAQQVAFSNGLSNARTLAETPHGRGAALDMWPIDFDPKIDWDLQPLSIKGKFATYGALAETHGLTWGGKWLSLGRGHGDQPHIEVPGWQSLPLAAL